MSYGPIIGTLRGVEHPAELRLIADRSLEGGVGRQVNC
jgi:hypothetical protein